MGGSSEDISRLKCRSAPADVLALTVMSYSVLPVLVARRSGCSSILHDETGGWQTEILNMSPP